MFWLGTMFLGFRLCITIVETDFISSFSALFLCEKLWAAEITHGLQMATSCLLQNLGSKLVTNNFMGIVFRNPCSLLPIYWALHIKNLIPVFNTYASDSFMEVSWNHTSASQTLIHHSCHSKLRLMPAVVKQNSHHFVIQGTGFMWILATKYPFLGLPRSRILYEWSNSTSPF